MEGFDRLVRFLISMFFLLMIFAFPVFVGLVVLSLLIVPLTYLFAILTERSYSSTIDSSNFLYRMNKIGQWSYFVVACMAIFYFTLKIIQ